MLLWKDTYGPETIPDSSDGTGATNDPWRCWPRPPGGFVDLGCGNGLLTHILVSEGYAGHGFDLRARTSWAHYPPATQSRLLVCAHDPTAAPRDSNHSDTTSTTLLPAESFLIGNHADELTPWVPLLATRVCASGYLSIPCCAWGLDTRFDRARDVPLCDVDVETLNLGGGQGIGSSYAQYRVWLASLSMHCGWAVEVEVLRIPSTRNWAIVGECFILPHPRVLSHDLCSGLGRKRVGSSEVADDNVEELIEGVRRRGQFKTRRPEGKAGGDH